VPADAEFVIEGLIDPELLEPEGPFGESHGLVALEGYNMSMQVTAITHKRSPVWVSILSEVTPSESSVMKRVAYEPRYLAFLRDTLAIKGVRRVVMHEPLTNLRKVLFVQFAPGVPRTEIWRALHGAATLQADIGKYVIGVSEDIDPENPDAVFWSLAYRANPIEDVHIAPYRSPGHGAKSEDHGDDSTMLIDATQKEPDPPLSLPKREYMDRARTIWQELGLPPLTMRYPWHGYSLGDWDAVWDTYAARAVTGKWEETGKETFAQRRAGLTPETPVKDVKDVKE
jgi:3-polyprenyl-4-hydroxybenzoate decarboxylase